MIYLNNAATSFPKPESVLTSMMFAQKHIGGNAGRGGNKSSLQAGELIFQTREMLAEMFNCESENVIFTNNCTTALNTAIYGIAEKGDHFIISSLEHNSVLRPLYHLKEKGQINYDIAFADPHNDDVTVGNFARLVRSNTKAIITTHVSNVFGTVLPIQRIGEICKRKKKIFIVDGAQSAGNFVIDMKENNIDILCIPGHKGLFGPMGTGAMLLSGRVFPRELTKGGTGSHSLEKSQPSIVPDRYESGTANLPGIAGLLSGLKFIRKMGGEQAIHRKEIYLAEYLKDELKEISNIKLYDNCGKLCAPIVTLNIENLHSEEVAAALDEDDIAVRGGYQCSYLAHNFYDTFDKGVVRISLGFFTTKNDIKNLIFSLNKIANQKYL